MTSRTRPPCRKRVGLVHPSHTHCAPHARPRTIKLGEGMTEDVLVGHARKHLYLNIGNGVYLSLKYTGPGEARPEPATMNSSRAGGFFPGLHMQQSRRGGSRAPNKSRGDSISRRRQFFRSVSDARSPWVGQIGDLSGSHSEPGG